MKELVYAVFALSSLSLLVLLLKSQLSRAKVKQFIIHSLLAGALLFGMNYFEFTEAFAIPINLITLSTTAVLGVPGIALLVGIQYVL